MHKELQTKRNRDPKFLKTTTSEPAVGTHSLSFVVPSSPHTHLSLPLPTINDPLDEILPMSLNLEELFDHLDLDIPHISPTLEHITEPILKPIEETIEPTPTPSLQPIITHLVEETTNR